MNRADRRQQKCDLEAGPRRSLVVGPMSGSLRTTLRPLTIAEAAVFTAARPRGLNRTNHDKSRERRGPGCPGRSGSSGRLRTPTATGNSRACRGAAARLLQASLPWRAAAVLVAVVTAGLLTAQVVADLAGLLGVVAAVGLGWRLRFRPSADTLAWRRGAAGERRTARLLAPLERRGWAVLHDQPSPARRPTLITWSSAPAASWSLTPSSIGGGCG
jgi:hypothetical protein